MSKIELFSPFECCMWKLHDRMDDYLTEESCREEIKSFSQHGQVVPALGRLLRDCSQYKVELICGARRLFVSRHLNKPLMVELRDMSDKEAIVAMDIENRQRQDISPYERGRSYRSWLSEKYFDSQEAIARELKISPSQVSRLLKLAQLPSVIVSAFKSPADICETWGLKLVEALEDDSRRRAIIRQARIIGAMDGRPAPEEVHRQLLAAAAPGRKVSPKAHDEVVHGSDGTPLFRIRQGANAIAFLFPTELVSSKTLRNIRDSLTKVLEDTSQSCLVE